MTDDIRCPECNGPMRCEICWDWDGLWREHLSGLWLGYVNDQLRHKLLENEQAMCDLQAELNAMEARICELEGGFGTPRLAGG